MKHLKQYENYKSYPAFSASRWNNIEVNNDIITVNVYKLSDEMLNSIDENPDERDEDEVKKLEEEYTYLIRGLLIGKVISFSSTDYSNSSFGDDETIMDICDDIAFEGAFAPPERGFFHVEFIQIKLEGDNEYYNLDDDEIKVYLNEDPELFRATSKYNL